MSNLIIKIKGFSLLLNILKTYVGGLRCANLTQQLLDRTENPSKITKRKMIFSSESEQVNFDSSESDQNEDEDSSNSNKTEDGESSNDDQNEDKESSNSNKTKDEESSDSKTD